MKNQTTNPTKIGENTNTRNFFQKTVILLAILAFSSFGFKAKAQLKFDIDVNNTGGCTMQVKAYDSGGNLLDSIQCTSGSITNSGCITSGLVTVNRIDITRASCTTISFYATSTTSGVINYSSVLANCLGCSYTAMTCAGSGGGTQCGGTNDFHYLVEIKP